MQRGEHVVVEPRAAEFFEARVLSVGRGELRVEPVGGGEPRSVAPGDVYPLPVSPVAARKDQLLICRVRGHWMGCRVEAGSERELRVRTLSSESVVVVASGAALVPTPLTEMNLRQRFTRVRERKQFEDAVARAGEPLRPAGFRVLPRGRVVARRGPGWYSGVVHEVLDEGAYVTFEGDGLRERIADADIVPEPPYPAAPARGDFALVRPLSPVEAWSPVRILGVNAHDFKVQDVSTEERVVGLRDLLPLAPGQ